MTISDLALKTISLHKKLVKTRWMPCKIIQKYFIFSNHNCMQSSTKGNGRVINSPIVGVGLGGRACVCAIETRLYGLVMDNYRRLHSHLGAGAKTSLGVCLAELKH